MTTSTFLSAVFCGGGVIAGEAVGATGFAEGVITVAGNSLAVTAGVGEGSGSFSVAVGVVAGLMSSIGGEGASPDISVGGSGLVKAASGVGARVAVVFDVDGTGKALVATGEGDAEYEREDVRVPVFVVAVIGVMDMNTSVFAVGQGEICNKTVLVRSFSDCSCSFR